MFTKSQQLQFNQVSLNSSDVFLASYPCSGNRWLRFLIADLICQIHNLETQERLPIPIKKITPNIYKNDINDIDIKLELPFRLIKTHELYNKSMEKLIFIFRNPLDVLPSYYYFLKAASSSNNIQAIISPGINQFCLKKIDEWYQHILSYCYGYKANQLKVFFISYENLRDNTGENLQSIMNFLNIQVSQQQSQKAIANHGSQKEQEYNNKSSFTTEAMSQEIEELSDSTVSQILEKTTRLFNQAKIIETRNSIYSIKI